MPNKLPKVFKAIAGWRGDSLACPQAFGGDIFQGCSMGCWFCFCRELENRTYSNVYSNWKPGMVRSCDPEDFRRLFDRALGSDKPSKDWTIQCLRRKVPFNMGSKAETFCPEDWEYASVVPVLEVFRDYEYPIILETKTHFVGMQRYLELLKTMRVAIIVAITGGKSTTLSKLEPGVASAPLRWTYVKHLNQMGIWTGVRWEPIMAGINSSDDELLQYAQNCKKFGARHASVYNYRTSDMTAACLAFEERGFDFVKMIQANETEWPTIGAKIFRYMNDVGVPCSSPDFVNFGIESECESCCGLDNHFGVLYKFNFMHAIRVAQEEGQVQISDLLDLDFKHPKAEKLLIDSWNGSKRIWTLSDCSFMKVDGRDSRGFKIYRISDMKAKKRPVGFGF